MKHFSTQNNSQSNIFSGMLAIILFFTIFFAGCSHTSVSSEHETNPANTTENENGITAEEEAIKKQEEEIKQLAEEERAIQQEIKKAKVKVRMKTIEDTEDTLRVQVILHNPTKRGIQSVQSWIIYPKSILTGKSITLENTEVFGLIAPDEMNFDTEKGMVKIGVSAEGTPKSTPEEVVVAEVVFEKTSDDPFLLAFFSPNMKVMSMTKNGLRDMLSTK
jgi:hypothetical protein